LIKVIGVVGAGTMGNGIAQVFAQAGFEVCLVDVAGPILERAKATIEKSLATFIQKGSLTPGDRDLTLARLTTSTCYRTHGGETNPARQAGRALEA